MEIWIKVFKKSFECQKSSQKKNKQRFEFNV